MKRLSQLLLASGLVLATLATGTAVASPPPGTKLAPEQVLNYNFTDIDSFDPSLVAFDQAFTLLRMTSATLYRQSEKGDFVPDLAESYTVSPDKLTWTFKLRPNAKWSDGKPITAQDFVYSWRRLADPKTGAIYSNYFDLMTVKNAEAVNQGKLPPEQLGIKALDDKTFQVELTKPTPWLISMLSLSVLTPLRQDIIEKYGKDWTKPENMVVSGPYKITNYRFKDTLNLVRNPLYWDNKNTTVNNINIDFIADPNASYFGYLTGKYLTTAIPAQFKAKVLKERPNELVNYRSQSIAWLLLNPKRVPDVRAREAINLLIDRNTLTKKIYKNNLATTMLVPADIQGAQYVKESPSLNRPMAENRAEAIKLLEAAGYTKDKPLKLKYLTGTSPDRRRYVALRDWFDKGSQGLINLAIDPVDNKIWYDRLAAKDYDLTFTGWNADYPQVSTFLSVFTCGNPVSSSYFCDPEYDKLLDQAQLEDDPDKRAKLYAKAELLVRDSYDFLPLWQEEGTYLKNPRLQGYNPNNPYRYFNDYYILAKDAVPASNSK